MEDPRIEDIPITDLYERAFKSPNFTFEYGNTKFEFQPKEIGKIRLMTGKVIACDPFYLVNECEFEQHFPQGDFPVDIAVLRIEDDSRIAFARIRFSDTIPAMWEMATRLQENNDEFIDEHNGYGVDSGTGCFTDRSFAENLKALSETEQEQFFEEVESKLGESYQHTFSWCVDRLNETNIICFSSGVGDGMYASYIGYDENGQVCRLITDFKLFADK